MIFACNRIVVGGSAEGPALEAEVSAHAYIAKGNAKHTQLPLTRWRGMLKRVMIEGLPDFGSRA